MNNLTDIVPYSFAFTLSFTVILAFTLSRLYKDELKLSLLINIKTRYL